MRSCLVVCALFVGGPVAAAGKAPATSVDWPALRAPVIAGASAGAGAVVGAVIDDEFAALPDAMFDALRLVVRGRMADPAAGPGAAEARQRGTVAEAGLRAQGVDVDGLLARREQVMAQRQAHVEGGVPARDGTWVRLGGRLLPVTREGGPVAAYVLMPWAGACSHQPPPPADQAVHLSPSQADAAALSAGPVWVSGVLRVRPLSLVVFKVDGAQALRVAYTLEESAITPMQPDDSAPQRFR